MRSLAISKGRGRAASQRNSAPDQWGKLMASCHSPDLDQWIGRAFWAVQIIEELNRCDPAPGGPVVERLGCLRRTLDTARSLRCGPTPSKPHRHTPLNVPILTGETTALGEPRPGPEGRFKPAITTASSLGGLVLAGAGVGLAFGVLRYIF